MSPEQLAQALAQHPDAVAVCSTLCETSTGVAHDIAAFGRWSPRRRPCCWWTPSARLGVMECRTDDWHIDICVTGSQKALMLPPGLAFVSVSDKAWERIDKNAVSADVLFRPEEGEERPRQQRDAVHAGAHAAHGAAGQPEADSGGGDRERLEAAGAQRGGGAGRLPGDGHGVVRAAAGRRPDGGEGAARASTARRCWRSWRSSTV